MRKVYCPAASTGPHEAPEESKEGGEEGTWEASPDQTPEDLRSLGARSDDVKSFVTCKSDDSLVNYQTGIEDNACQDFAEDGEDDASFYGKEPKKAAGDDRDKSDLVDDEPRLNDINELHKGMGEEEDFIFEVSHVL